nr:MAG TPA_asm: hypothetical protein [Caudoviricetes sp.]
MNSLTASCRSVSNAAATSVCSSSRIPTAYLLYAFFTKKLKLDIVRYISASKKDQNTTTQFFGVDLTVAFNPQRERSELHNPLRLVCINDMADRVSIHKHIARTKPVTGIMYIWILHTAPLPPLNMSMDKVGFKRLHSAYHHIGAPTVMPAINRVTLIIKQYHCDAMAAAFFCTLQNLFQYANYLIIIDVVMAWLLKWDHLQIGHITPSPAALATD